MRFGISATSWILPKNLRTRLRPVNVCTIVASRFVAPGDAFRGKQSSERRKDAPGALRHPVRHLKTQFWTSFAIARIAICLAPPKRRSWRFRESPRKSPHFSVIVTPGFDPGMHILNLSGSPGLPRIESGVAGGFRFPFVMAGLVPA